MKQSLKLVIIYTFIIHVDFLCYFIVDPEPPLNLTASVLNCSSLNVTWLRPAIVGFSDVFLYELTISPAPSSPAGSYIDGACTTDEEFLVVTGLELYTMEYTINVRTSLCSTDSFSSNTTMTQGLCRKKLICNKYFMSYLQNHCPRAFH